MFRLRKSRLFWWAVILTALATAGIVLLDSSAISGSIRDNELENIALSGAPFVQIIGAAVIVLFLGTDHSHNTIRNKLIVGSRRSGIYSADVLTGIVIGCSINTAWLLGGLSGVPVLGFWKMETARAFMYIGMSFVCTVSLSSVAALIGVLIRRRSTAVIIALTGVLALILSANNVHERLSSNEEDWKMDFVDGEPVFELVKNPGYVDGTLRMVFELALNLNPMSVSVALSNRELADPTASLVGTAFVTVFAGSLGAAVFGRKDFN